MRQHCVERAGAGRQRGVQCVGRNYWFTPPPHHPHLKLYLPHDHSLLSYNKNCFVKVALPPPAPPLFQSKFTSQYNCINTNSINGTFCFENGSMDFVETWWGWGIHFRVQDGDFTYDQTKRSLIIICIYNYKYKKHIRSFEQTSRWVPPWYLPSLLNVMPTSWIFVLN